MNLEQGSLAAEQIRAMALLEASRDEELENAMTELAVAQSHAAASQSAANQATALMEELDANRENIGTGNYDYTQWSADVAAANTEVSQIATAEAAARTARTTAGNATIAAAKTENAAIRAAAEQTAEVQYKNDTTWDEVEYLATIFDLEASYVYALMENLDTGLEAALDKYMATVDQAEQVYDNEMCRLDGRYYDAMNLIPSGGTIDANFYENGATSVNVQVCFAAGTPVLLADGSSKAIEKIEVGDMVLARHHENPTGELMQCKVVRVFQNGSKKTYKLTFDSGFMIQATPEHPFYVKDQGWVSCEKLEIGTTCVSAENTPQILVSKELDSEPVPVYNFEVENAHTYFVGENNKNAVLVHNICPGCGPFGGQHNEYCLKGLLESIRTFKTTLTVKQLSDPTRTGKEMNKQALTFSQEFFKQSYKPFLPSFMKKALQDSPAPKPQGPLDILDDTYWERPEVKFGFKAISVRQQGPYNLKFVTTADFNDGWKKGAKAWAKDIDLKEYWEAIEKNPLAIFNGVDKFLDAFSDETTLSSILTYENEWFNLELKYMTLKGFKDFSKPGVISGNIKSQHFQSVILSFEYDTNTSIFSTDVKVKFEF